MVFTVIFWELLPFPREFLPYTRNWYTTPGIKSKRKKKINEKMHTFIQYKFIYSLLIIHWSCINLQQIWKWTSTSDVVLSGFCRWDSYFSGVCWRNTTGIVDNEDLGLPSIKPRCPAQEDWLPGVRYHRQIIRSFRPIWECNATKVEA